MTYLDTPDAILTRVSGFLRRYVVFRSDAQVTAISLWILHTWTFDAADASPYLYVNSPEKRSGKTRLFDVLELLIARPWRVITPSEAVVYRKLDRDKPTLLLDEVDAIFRDKGNRYEPLRALLNAGNRPGTVVPRCLGEGAKMNTVDFQVFTPKALAGLGGLPDTVADRSIPIRLQRRAPGEVVSRFRYRGASALSDPIREALEAWCERAVEQLDDATPDIPEALDDRAADGWEPLLAIADLAGLEWPTRAREAAVLLHGDTEAQEETLGIQLLRDTFRAFAEGNTDRMTTADLVKFLCDEGEGPWAEWWAKAERDGDLRGPGRTLANRLRPFGVKPKKLRIGEDTAQGYDAEDLEEAWQRYLPAPSPQGPSTRNKGTSEVRDTPSDLQGSLVPSGPPLWEDGGRPA